MSLLIVVVNYKTAAYTRKCLRALEPEVAGLPGSRVVVVDNASGDGAELDAAIRENGWEDWVSLDVAEANGGQAYGWNRPIRRALGSDEAPAYVLLLDPDTEVRPGALRTLVGFLETHPDVGIAGCGFENLDGSDWPLAFRFFSIASELDDGLRLGLVSRLLKNQVLARTMAQDVEARVDWVSGACMMVRRAVFEDVGLTDEGYFAYFEETDFCLRAHRAGWPIWYVPQSRVMHIRGQSTGIAAPDRKPGRRPAYWFESRRRYFLKNHGLFYALAADLAFGLGYSLFRVRRAIQRKPDTDPPHFLRDFWAHSVLFRRDHRTAPG
jgi:N-acetylglucosaminyl-diphospho-decaprenol L-rhamnosyltransferase